LGLKRIEVRDVALSVYESEKEKPPKHLLARAFGLSRSALYYVPTLPQKDLLLKNKILKWHETDDTLGSRKLAALIGKSRGCVARVMLKYDIYPRRKRLACKYPGKADEVIENKLLTKDLTDQEILFSDIFQFRLGDSSWVYCCFVIRKKTRQILSFCYSWGMRAELVTESITRVDLIDDLTKKDVIFHSDQGKQYGAKITIEACLALYFERSMSRAGTPTDNAIAERFIQTFKLAVVERYSYETIGEFEEFAEKWLNFYNNERPHESLRQISPNKYATKKGLKNIPYLSVNFV
jgi:putative transposase